MTTVAQRHLRAKINAASDYFKIYDQYSKTYGKIAILYELGGFYEIFGVDNEVEKIANATEIGNDVGIRVSRSNNKIERNSRENPQQAGFPVGAVDKYIKKLVDLDYHVIVYAQIDDPSLGKKKRVLDRIISKATLTDDIKDDDSHNLVFVYMERDMGKIDAGVTVVDFSTGKCVCHSVIDDAADAFVSISTIVQSAFPKELIVCTNAAPVPSFSSDIITPLVITPDKCLLKESYQSDMLSKVYPGKMNPVDALDIGHYPTLIVSLVGVIRYVHEQDSTIVERLSRPIVKNHSSSVKLSYSTILQLNLVQSENTNRNSLFDIINFTSTPMGRRVLKTRLLTPITDPAALRQRYEDIEGMLIDKKYVSVISKLKDIGDLERIHRRIFLKKLDPSELPMLDASNVAAWIIMKKGYRIPKLTDFQIRQFRRYVTLYRKTIDLKLASKYNLQDIKKPIFKKGLYADIDKFHQENVNAFGELWAVKKALTGALFGEPDDAVKLSYTNTDGYYFTTTKKRASMLVLTFPELDVRQQRSTTKIFSMRIKELSRIILHTQEKIISLNKTRFQEFLDNWSQEFSVTMRIISDFVTHIDVIASNAKAADVYKWCKPKIEELPTKASYITARGVRHPIVEKVGVEKYVVNDVLIGAHDPTGILLFGVNSSGKSVYLKSIGIAVILSQAGLYVPAKTFTYYPFHHIVTKISMNDNIYKHRSTFECEMLDLMRMLDKASPNIIILADELCSGTNTTDAISLVGSSVIDFSQKAANFVFTSHLHQLINIPEIVSLRSVSFKHISVDVDASGIHYSRTLKDGSGPSTYGIELASFMGVGSESFIKNAKAIRNTLDRNSQSKSLVSTKSSRYNTNLHLTACDVCGSTEKLETHHITPQVLADENGMLPDGRHKNHRSNLQVLCEGCHDKIPTQRKTTKMKNK